MKRDGVVVLKPSMTKKQVDAELRGRYSIRYVRRPVEKPVTVRDAENKRRAVNAYEDVAQLH